MRVLNRSDLPAAIRLLSANPIENVFVASRVRAAGLEQASLGCPVWGYQRGGLLRALCHAGSNLVPVNADEDALEAWAEFAGPERMCASIIGPSHVALELWNRLSERWGASWARFAMCGRTNPCSRSVRRQRSRSISGYVESPSISGMPIPTRP